MSWSPDLRRHAVSCRGGGVTCYAMARNPEHALRIARTHGLTVARCGYAVAVNPSPNPKPTNQTTRLTS